MVKLVAAFRRCAESVASGRRRRAFALFTVLIAVLLLLGAGALLVLHVQVRMALVRDQQRNMALQSLLDSGYAVVAGTVREDYGFDGELELELDGGLVRMEIDRIVGLGLPPGLRHVDMTAFYRGEVRRAEGFLRIPSPGAAPELYGLEPVPLGDRDRIEFE